MKKAWLNAILHLSSYIYKQKNIIIGAALARSVYLAFCIILLEFLLFLVSLPTYFLFNSGGLDKVKGYNDEIKKYKLQRKVTLVVVLSVIGIFLFKVLLLISITVLSGAPAVS